MKVSDVCVDVIVCHLESQLKRAARAGRREDNDPADNGGVESGK